MCPKVTKNGSSLQIIIPKSVCDSARIEAGEQLNVMTDGDTISLIRPTAPMLLESEEIIRTIFTIGYETRDIDKFIKELKKHGVLQIIDVREKPISRKKGFSKTSLRERLMEENISYVHLPKLGSPSEIRQEYKEGGSEALFFEKYKSYLETVSEQIDILDEHASYLPSALMCFELSHIHCHRKVIANELKNIGYLVVNI
jgi:uncharacterized protein (DUF488 family)/antitoxin component of MazEF toxin-antitoxin module